MAQLNESKLRQIIKEEIKSLLKERIMVPIDRDSLSYIISQLEGAAGALHWCKDVQKMPNDAPGQAAKEACKLVDVIKTSTTELRQSMLRSHQNQTR